MVLSVAPPTTAGPSLAEALTDATAWLARGGIESARLDAEVLLAAACGWQRAALYVNPHHQLPPVCRNLYRAWLKRRLAREPLSYIVGCQEFWSLEFFVSPAVLIPRPETELLVEIASGLLGSGSSLCDVGTGSGCLAVALAHEIPRCDVWALDLSTAALQLAARNAVRHGVVERIRFYESDLFAAVPGRRFDLVVANPPYVSARALAAAQPELAWEPRLALDGGAEGLDVIGRLLTAAPSHLVEGGWLLVEIGAEQGAAVLQLARGAGFQSAEIRRDYAGLPRVLLARC